MHIHVVAVSGAGMGPLAGLLASLGHRVTGSDVAFDPPIGPRLQEWNVECVPGFYETNLEPTPDLVVIGNLCRASNPEAAAALRLGIPYTHIGGALSRFALQGTQPFVVAGTHGKTTTSAVLAGLLDALGEQPGYFIGGVPVGLSGSFRAALPRQEPDAQPSLAEAKPLRAVPPFVLEGDEYDTAFFEKTAKFLHYGAHVAVLTSMEHDHIDIYPSPQDYRRPFARFVAELPADGLVVAWAGSEEVARVVTENARCPIVWYGLESEPRFAELTWEAELLPSDEGGVTAFELSLSGEPKGRFETPLLGAHNVRNCLAAMAAASHARGFSAAALREPLALARGVERRQQLLVDANGILVYDDFAHHPTAVTETLKALRRRHPRSRLIAVFEPRSATACSALHQELYPRAFQSADRVLLAPVARELDPNQRLDTRRLAQAARALGTRATAHASLEEILRELSGELRTGDVVAILSNGRFGGIQQRLQQQLASGNGGA